MNPQEYTFKSLFGSTLEYSKKTITLEEIKIPIIQRDYAQGRTSEKVEKIRNRFLQALYNAIVGQKHITLDFVYGDVSEEGVLTPLDGQQRLTTLFLLHWYIAKKEKETEVSEYIFLNKFSYATRFSSRDFCKELVNYTPNFNETVISDSITNQHWYPSQWKNDPTIQGMLVMIDAIHAKFKAEENLWEKLVNNQMISFYFLPLTEMGLSDDLYIKMNSRGKPLTPFEHFKAEFEEIIKKKSEDLSKEINHKFDIDWTDMLFPYRGSDNTIGTEFMRYFRFVSDILFYQSEMELEKDEFEIAEKLYSNKNDNAQCNINFLKSVLDCWCNFDINDFFQTIFSCYQYQQGKVKIYQQELNIFKECLDNYGEYSGRNRRYPLNKTLLLYAVVTYLQNKEHISEQDFIYRIRNVRNLIWNSSDEIRDDRMKTLLYETKEIILTGVVPETVTGSLGYSVTQKTEERAKIEWLVNNSNKQDSLFHLEDHTLLKGCIAVIGLNNSHNFDKFRELFNNCAKDTVNRALLTLGDFSQEISWRFQVGSAFNESVWIDLFHPTTQRIGFHKTSNTLNKLLNYFTESTIDEDALLNQINQYLNNLDTQKDWRYYFVKYQAMRLGRFGMYYWRDKLIMLNTEKSIGGRNWNVVLYTLSRLPEFANKLSLGEYAYQGDILGVKGTNYRIDCVNHQYIVYKDKEIIEHPILQDNEGVDIEDRIEKGIQIIIELLNNPI